MRFLTKVIVAIISSLFLLYFGETSISLNIYKILIYICYSLARIFISLIISVVLSIIIGGYIAKSMRSGPIIEIIIDVLQSIPTLAFLLAFFNYLRTFFINDPIWYYHTTIILSLVSAQIWNMILSVIQSFRTIPSSQIRLIQNSDLNMVDQFIKIELPYIISSLSWNTMLSTAASWFVVVQVEAIVLDNKNIYVPGIGSFIALANETGNLQLVIISAVMILLLIAVIDSFVFSPLISFANKLTKGEISYNWIEEITLNLPTRVIEKVLQVSAVTIQCLIVLTLILQAPSFLCFLGTQLSLLPSLGSILSQIGLLTGLCCLTFVRILLVILISSVIGIPLGIFAEKFLKGTVLETSARLMLQIFTSLPINLFYFIIFFFEDTFRSNFELMSIIPMFICTQWYVIFNVIAGASKDTRYYEDIFRKVNIFKQFTKIYLPSILPEYFTGVLAAAGAAWNASLFCEYIQWSDKTPLISHGIGSYLAIQYGNQGFVLGVIVMSLFIVLLNVFFWNRIMKIIAEYR